MFLYSGQGMSLCSVKTLGTNWLFVCCVFVVHVLVHLSTTRRSSVWIVNIKIASAVLKRFGKHQSTDAASGPSMKIGFVTSVSISVAASSSSK